MQPALAPAFETRSLLALAVLVIACFAVGAVGSAVTMPAIPTWYAGLEKPAFTPPNSWFGPVWSLLYAMMAVAAWRVVRVRGDHRRRTALVAFAVQLGLNLAWSFAFFGARSPALGLAVILALEAAILSTDALFFRLDRPAGWLLIPYALWVAFAMLLNGAVFVLN